MASDPLRAVSFRPDPDVRRKLADLQAILPDVSLSEIVRLCVLLANPRDLVPQTTSPHIRQRHCALMIGYWHARLLESLPTEETSP